MSTNEETEAPIGFEAWLKGASGVQRVVEVLQDGELLAEWDAWVNAYQRALDAEDQPDSPDEQYQNPGATLTDALALEGKALLVRVRAARTAWWLTGIQPDIQEEIDDENPYPENPVPELPSRPKAPVDEDPQAFQDFVAATELWEKKAIAHAKKYAAKAKEHKRAKRKVTYTRGAQTIARAFVKATDASGTVLFTSVTAEGLLKAHELLGDSFLVPLFNKVSEISTTAPKVPGDSDFLSVLSGNARGYDDE